MTNPNINSFAVTQVAGQPDLQFQGSVVTARVSSNQATALVAGQAVKLENSGLQGLPNVLAITADTDKVFGIVLRNLKDQTFAAGHTVEIARDQSVVYLPASAAIARGAAVEIDYSTLQVTTWGGTNTCIGEAFDAAVNTGDLIRVWVKLPIVSTPAAAVVQVVDVTATIAQINAGLVLVAGVSGKSVKVLNYIARVAGNFATGTSVELESTNGTPVAVSTLAEAGLTDGAVLVPASANTTLGVGFGKAMGAGDGLKVVNNGTAQTGGTSIEFTIEYQQF